MTHIKFGVNMLRHYRYKAWILLLATCLK